MIAGQAAGMVGVPFFHCFHDVTEVLIVFLQFTFFHGKKPVIIAMNIFMNRMEHGYVNRILRNLRQCHMNLFVDFDEGISLRYAAVDAFTGLVEQRFDA